jgi:ribonuclease HIII
MLNTKNPIELYDKIRHTLEANGFSILPYSTIDYGLQFTISNLQWSGVLRLFQNKKGVLKIDYSQLKGENAIFVQQCINGKEIESGTQNENLSLGFPIIGSDESGKGDYFGPLVASAVFVDAVMAAKLQALGVRDCKELSDSKVSELAKSIPTIILGKYSIIEIAPEKYNELYSKFKSENKNLNVLLAWGHAKAIEEVLTKADCVQALADQFADERFIQSKLQERGKKIKLYQMHKAEKNIAVAAASILARDRFLTKLSKLSELYGIQLSKGASSDTINAAKSFVRIHGKDMLNKVAKMHFKTTDSVLT